ncbi:hypothetical protein PAPYRUS_45 [Mycobacterium phage Papyrus]|uniref:Uncharacterized protein n=1 Tax=Mycobacterium phage Papyrus TaxID=1383056 RepID=S5YE20_9CAUD|nr:hypothetical protein N842_gp045 [Mycobacterium phage Papyrus]AGT14055.1 hypothetical protein PAPYRUS_45 [Mycobacterium phage Papyrus]
MSNFEYQAVDPAAAAVGFGKPLLNSPRWAEENCADTLLSVKAGGAGDLYLTDQQGNVFVKFDSGHPDQVHAAARWLSVFIQSIES